MYRIIEFVPVITTVLSIIFFREIFSHYRNRKTKYLLWWSIGVLTYGLGTLSESIHSIFGWSEFNLKFWYILGALLGGFPLAQGSVYLLMKKKFANLTTYTVGIIIIFASIFIILTPLKIPGDFTYQLTGSVFTWNWVRYFAPLINTYSFIFLVGGAIYSAIIYFRQEDKEARFKGNVFIAIGGLLPGIGGVFTRMGHVHVLFITELIGLLFMYFGYRIIKLDKHSNKA